MRTAPLKGEIDGLCGVGTRWLGGRFSGHEVLQNERGNVSDKNER